MRLASWRWGGTDHVGTISHCGREATPLACRDASLGVLPLIDALARGAPLPPAAGTRLPVHTVTLRAPIPLPRRNIFCVGRNYRSHAAELAGSVQAPPIERYTLDAAADAHARLESRASSGALVLLT
jgi:2-keto-4-pentenoate hydratase/2-oxohepta-3-ene-1,7-dioic acid hydratase in catechol pathway